MTAANRKYSLAELSARFELELRGDGDVQVDSVGTLVNGSAGQVTFLANPAYRKDLPRTRASVVILREDDAADCPTHCLVSDDPYLSYARVAALFDARPAGKPGVHASAVVAESARLAENVSIGPNAVIGEDCQLAEGCTIGPGTVLEAECRLDEGCRLYANVTLGFGTRLGKRVIVHPGAVIGADGFGIAFARDHWEKVPQLGKVVIGDDCEIGANTCIDRGAVEDTVLEEDVRIDNLCQIAHNVHIGAHTACAAKVGISGSTRIGRYCMLAGASATAGHLVIADRTTIGADSAVFRSITEPGTTWSAQLPARPIRQWQRNLARLNKLDELARSVSKLQKQPGTLKKDD